MTNIRLENTIEYELKDYKNPLIHRIDKTTVIGTHDALISHSAYTLAKMWLDGKWKDDLWCSIFDETEKAILVDFGHLYWIPKRLIKKVRKIRQVEA